MESVQCPAEVFWLPAPTAIGTQAVTHSSMGWWLRRKDGLGKSRTFCQGSLRPRLLSQKSFSGTLLCLGSSHKSPIDDWDMACEGHNFAGKLFSIVDQFWLVCGSLYCFGVALSLSPHDCCSSLAVPAL